MPYRVMTVGRAAQIYLLAGAGSSYPSRPKLHLTRKTG